MLAGPGPLLLLLLPLLAPPASGISGPAGTPFRLPQGFEGLWRGVPAASILGPWNVNYTFGITRTENGDYLMDDNVLYIDNSTSWQRFYVSSSGPTRGVLWYCGTINKYSQAPETVPGQGQIFKADPNSVSNSSVTFCLDEPDGPFPVTAPENCKGCDCANWTFVLSQDGQQLHSELRMGAAMGHSHSIHLLVDLKRIGPPPPPDVTQMPSWDNFTCDNAPGGRDTRPVIFPTTRKRHHETHSRRVCPHRHSGYPNPAKEEFGRAYDHCYILNHPLEYRLEWTYRSDDGMLDVRVSTKAPRSRVYVAIGFRPLARWRGEQADKLQTGFHDNFGMKGADIVLGDPSGVTTMFADKYTGPPIHDESLKIVNASVSKDNTTALTFSRPVVGGYLLANYGINVSIVSEAADIIWAVGPLETSGSASYHGYWRGLRFVDWANPDDVFTKHLEC